MKRFIFSLFFLLMFVPNALGYDISTQPTMSDAIAGDSVLVIDASASSGNKLRRVLFSGDDSTVLDGVGSFSSLADMIAALSDLDMSSVAINTILLAGVDGAEAGILMNDATPNTTTGKLYRTGTDLYFNGVKLVTEDAAVTGLQWQGLYDASTNTPTLPDASEENDSYFWRVNVAGTQLVNGVSTDLNVGDWIISNGTALEIVETTENAFVGATDTTDGAGGEVPQPMAGEENETLHGDGTWRNPYSAMTEDSNTDVTLAADFTVANTTFPQVTIENTDAAYSMQFGVGTVGFGIKTSAGEVPFVIGDTALGATGMVMDEDGLGIGTDDPYTLLHTYGGSSGLSSTIDTDILIEDDGNGYIQFLGGDDTNSGLVFGTTTADNDAYILFNNNTDTFSIRPNKVTGVSFTLNSDGDVGIKTDDPQSSLHISNGSSGGTPRGSAVATLEDNTSAYLQLLVPNTDSTGILFGDNDQDNIGYVTYDHNLDRMRFIVNDSTRVTIDSEGDVGIGTTDPDTALHVSNGSSGGTPLSYAEATIEDDESAYLQFLTPSTSASGIMFGDADSNTSGQIVYSNTNDDMSFVTSGSERMTVDSAGNVGIGTTDPQSILHLLNSGDATKLILGSKAADKTSLDISTTADEEGYARFQAVSVAGTSYGNIVLNPDGGNVGIRTTAPAYPLHVAGYSSVGSYADNYSYMTSTAISTGTGGTGTANVGLFVTNRIWSAEEIDCFSDRRAKKDITSLDEDNALEIVNNLRAVSYVWDDGREDSSPKLGWIAQEVGEAGIGEAVVLGKGTIRNEDGELEEVDDFHLIDKDQINAVLWAGVRGLSSKVDKLESEVSALKALVCSDHPDAAVCQ